MLTAEVEIDLRLAGAIGIPYDELDQRVTCRAYDLYLQFFRKHGYFPGELHL